MNVTPSILGDKLNTSWSLQTLTQVHHLSHTFVHFLCLNCCKRPNGYIRTLKLQSLRKFYVPWKPLMIKTLKSEKLIELVRLCKKMSLNTCSPPLHHWVSSVTPDNAHNPCLCHQQLLTSPAEEQIALHLYNILICKNNQKTNSLGILLVIGLLFTLCCKTLHNPKLVICYSLNELLVKYTIH